MHDFGLLQLLLHHHLMVYFIHDFFLDLLNISWHLISWSWQLHIVNSNLLSEKLVGSQIVLLHIQVGYIALLHLDLIKYVIVLLSRITL